MTARQLRRVVEHLKSRQTSERRACWVIGFSRSAIWRTLQGRDDGPLRTEGLVVNHKPTHRLYCEEGLQVRTKRRKKLYRHRVPMVTLAPA